MGGLSRSFTRAIMSEGGWCDKETETIAYCWPCCPDVCVMPVDNQPCATGYCHLPCCKGATHPRGCKLRLLQLFPFALVVGGMIAFTIIGATEYAQRSDALATAQVGNCTVLDATVESACPNGIPQECACVGTPETKCRQNVVVMLGGTRRKSARTDGKVDMSYWLGGDCGTKTRTCNRIKGVGRCVSYFT